MEKEKSPWKERETTCNPINLIKDDRNLSSEENELRELNLQCRGNEID